MPENQDLIPAKVPPELAAAAEAVEELKRDILALHNSPERIGLYLGLDIKTGRAELVLIPSKENILKYVKHFEDLPEGVREAVARTMPGRDRKATEIVSQVVRGMELPGKSGSGAEG